MKLIPPIIGSRKPTFFDISFPNIIPKYVIIPAVSENIDDDNKILFVIALIPIPTEKLSNDTANANKNISNKCQNYTYNYVWINFNYT